MKIKKWEKPEVSVLACDKRGKTGSLIRTGKMKYHLGPAPVPPYSGESLRIERAQYHLGPAPVPDYLGPAPAPFLTRS